ncbi:MAG: DUF11 domain-containing protein, partial [Gemmatimonadota bacterium]
VISIPSGAFNGSSASLVDITGININAGTSVTVVFRVTVDSAVPSEVTEISNQGLVGNIPQTPDEPTNDPDTPQDDDPTDTPLVAAPLLETFKRDALFMDNDDNGLFSPGDVLRYDITITNSGNTSATGVTFEDFPDMYTNLVVGSVTTTKGSILTGNGVGHTYVEIDIGEIAGGGGSVTIRFRVIIENPLPPGVDQVENQGIVGSNELDDEPTDDPDTPDEDDETVTPLTAAPVIEATKTDVLHQDNDGDSVPSPGDVLRYDITITNSGNQAASDVVFTDTPDPYTALIAGSVTTSQGTVTEGNGGGDTKVTIDVGTVPGGGSVDIRFRVLIDSPFPTGIPERVINQGFISSNELPDEPTDDPDTPAEDDETITELSISPNLEATKRDVLHSDEDSNGVPSPGDILKYTVVITNSGNAAATNVRFTDTPDANTELVVGSVTTSAGTIVRGNGSGHTYVRVDIGSIGGAGGQVTVTFQVVIDAPLPAGVDEVANQGLVTSSGLPDEPTDDPDTPEDDDETITPVEASPIIEALKRDILVGDSDGNGVASPGDTLLYELTIVNLGNMNASDVLFNDTPDTNTTLVVGSVTTTQGNILRGNHPGQSDVRVDIGTLQGGTSLSITFLVVIADPFPAGLTEVCNQGWITSVQVDPEPTDDPDDPADDDETDTPLVIAPFIESYKRDRLHEDVDHDGQPTPGDVLLYTVTIMNSGNTAASGVLFEDTPDPNTTLVVGSVTTSQGTVTSGNSQGDMTVAVTVGSLPGRGGQVEIEFQVIINDPLPIGVTFVANQGIVTNDHTDPEPTDDPDTPEDDDPTVTRAFWIIFKRGNTFPQAIASTFCPYIDVADGSPADGDTLIQVTTYTYDPDFDLWWDHPDAAGNLYPGSNLYVTYRFRTGSPVDSIFLHIPARGSTNPVRHPIFRAAGPRTGTWAIHTAGMHDFYGYDWKVYDEADRDDGVWYLVSEIYLSFDGSTTFITDTSSIILDSKDPIYHLTYTKESDGTPLPTIPHPTLGDIPLTCQQKVLITTTVDQTLPVVGNGRLWSWMDIFIFAQGERIDIDGVPAYADELWEQSRWVNDRPPSADTVMYFYTWDLMSADSTCDGIAEVRIKGRDTASNLVDIEDGEPNTGLHVFVDVTSPSPPDASKIIITDDGSAVGDLGAVGQDWFKLGLTVNFYNDGALTTLLGSTTALGNGSFTTVVSSFISTGDVVHVTAQDRAGNESSAVEVTVQETVVILEAFKHDTLLIDNDHDGLLTPGDVLKYTVSVENMSNTIATDVTEVYLLDAPDPNTNLLIGSVTTSRGIVLSGNTPGNTEVRVYFGNLRGMRSATVTFRVTVKDPLPPVTEIVNQGIVTSNEVPSEPTDDPETPAEDDPTTTAVSSGAVLFHYVMEPGWNLVSLPIVPGTFDLSILFPFAVAYWEYDGMYQEADLGDNGRGYFLLYNLGRHPEILGYPLERYTITLNPGWNLVGSVVEPVPVSDIIDVSTGQPAMLSCIAANSVYGYQAGQYYTTNIIWPGDGFWIYALYECTIEVQTSGALPLKGSVLPVEEPQWMAHIGITRNEQTHVLEFGQAATASKTHDPHLDLLAPPPLPQEDNIAVFTADLESGGPELLRDIKNVGPARWTIRLHADEGAYITLDVSNVPSDLSVKASLAGGSVEVPNGEPVWVEGSVVIKIEVQRLPTRFTLSQNYPNPFNPATRIGFQLPVIGDQSTQYTTLKIFNLLGREVRTLVDEDKEPGYYEVTWDGRDTFGNEVPSGVYFYRLSGNGGQLSETRRMILMK